jgi:hypothetical protein
MNNNKVLWIVGAVVVIGIGILLFTQGPETSLTSPTGTTNTPGPTGTVTTPTTNGTTKVGTPGKPIVTTTGFASVTNTTALVVGTVIPNGVQTTYWFEFGTTPGMGSQTSPTTVAAGYQPLGAATSLGNLKAGTQYYFRIGAKNSFGTVFGGPYSFITAAK